MKGHILTAIFSIILFIALCYVQIDLLYDPLPCAGIFLFYLISTLYLLPRLVRSLIKKRQKAGIRYLMLAVTIFSALILSRYAHKTQYVQSKDDGNRIISALDEYKKEKGHYPKSLTDLKPDILKSIPEPSIGFFKSHDYQYYKYKDHNRYILGFKFIAFLDSIYDSKTGKWVLKD